MNQRRENVSRFMQERRRRGDPGLTARLRHRAGVWIVVHILVSLAFGAFTIWLTWPDYWKAVPVALFAFAMSWVNEKSGQAWRNYQRSKPIPYSRGKGE